MKATERAGAAMGARRSVVGLLAATVFVVVAFPANAAPKAPSNQADLWVTTDAPDDKVAVGEEPTFAITVVNGGPSTARSGRLTIRVSGPASILDTSTSRWSCSGAGPVLCSIDQIPSGVTEQVRVRVRATGVGSITTIAEVVAAERDPYSGNNAALDTIEVVPGADLMVQSVATGGPTASTTHTITNNGPAVATGVRAKVYARAATIATPSQGTCTAGGSTWWTCDLGVLTNGQSVRVQVEHVEIGSARVALENGGFDGPTGARAFYGSGSSEAEATSTDRDPRPWNNRDGRTVAASSAGTSIVLCTLPGLRSVLGVCWHPY